MNTKTNIINLNFPPGDMPDIAPSPTDGNFRGTVAIRTQGCKLNQADSDMLARRFAAAGYRLVQSPAKADVFVLNTCTVTATADSKARQALRAAARANPGALIVATGCYAQRSRDELSQVEGVSLVIGNTEKEELPSMVTALLEQRNTGANSHPPVSSALDYSVQPAAGIRRNRSMVKIQEGCDQVCAYCIVPKVRGRERSIPPESLVEQINQRVAEGCLEVVLTGTQLGTYGFDIPGATLTRLLERILAETAVPRLRVSSLQPQEITPRLLELWQDPRLCRHFHIPLQSGSDRILEMMRRRYTTGLFAEKVDLVRKTVPGCGITADLIAGFPGETDAEFQESLAFARAMAFSDMHIFPYSPRPGTSAVYLPGPVSQPVKKARTAQLLAMAKEGFEAFRSHQLGQTHPVLWESSTRQDGGIKWRGLTGNYIRVYTHSRDDLGNTITPARLEELTEDDVRVEVP
ncbi:MAG: tRNA (N(6)-L-threonylcarbamoyladenosine(37)-C(2))-methylthiotransferase MtaB [Chloroflexi bacterium]|nr:tRNA (N(6)-L-threonylcarbamoyladenosine(37)-C(2))-methylthiotransferase MtaB [Chloroflexota bacterium]